MSCCKESDLYHAVKSLTNVSHSSILASHTAAQSSEANSICLELPGDSALRGQGERPLSWNHSGRPAETVGVIREDPQLYHGTAILIENSHSRFVAPFAARFKSHCRNYRWEDMQTQQPNS